MRIADVLREALPNDSSVEADTDGNVITIMLAKSALKVGSTITLRPISISPVK